MLFLNSHLQIIKFNLGGKISVEDPRNLIGGEALLRLTLTCSDNEVHKEGTELIFKILKGHLEQETDVEHNIKLYYLDVLTELLSDLQEEVAVKPLNIEYITRVISFLTELITFIRETTPLAIKFRSFSAGIDFTKERNWNGKVTIHIENHVIFFLLKLDFFPST